MYVWDDEAGFWVPENLQNHHGDSTLHERLLKKGLIREKTTEEVERDRQWQGDLAEHQRKRNVFRRRADALARALRKKHRPTKRRKGVGCVFCGRQESKDTYICSSCCIKLQGTSDESLRMSYVLAVWHRLEDKADALLDFLDPEVALEIENEIEQTRKGMIGGDNERATHEIRAPHLREDLVSVAQPSLF
ncbi:MAG: hypothetical protein SWE60_01885 [Thermodesulfobacteriota bacterium]|nr:hypothetical protein [Thermodesulfobacteriota bacterium]